MLFPTNRKRLKTVITDTQLIVRQHKSAELNISPLTPNDRYDRVALTLLTVVL